MLNDDSLVIEVNHFPKINLYKNVYEILKKQGHSVIFIIRPRGNLVSIFEKEYPGVEYKIIGKHRKSVPAKIFDMVYRDIEIARYLKKRPFNAGIGSYNLTQALWMLRKPSIILFDDPEYRFVYQVAKKTATWMVVPSHLPIKGKNILKYRGFKEIAYLHPNYFKPNPSVLKPYGLKPNEYVFIREVSNSSLNYRNRQMGRLSKVLSFISEKDMKIVLSIEDKSVTNLFKNKCIILKEPVEDIHSLLHFAALTISSGDSMARESALVGTPSVYTGGRDMAINKELIDRNFMFKADPDNGFLKVVGNIIDNNLKVEVGSEIKSAIQNEWDDTTQVMMDILKGTMYGDESCFERYKER